jgi:UDP-N-acetylglucosamine 3-dehydrogenase
MAFGAFKKRQRSNRLQKVRFGLAGVGEIVQEFHLPVMLQNPRVAVVAACSAHPQSARNVAQKFGIAKTYADYNLMARDPEIDAVVVSAPTCLHAAISLKMLRSGKHVLCEKPMAMSAADASKMIAAAEAARRVLAIAHPWRYDQDVHWLRSVIRSGRLGKIFKIRGHGILVGNAPSIGNWRFDPKIAGGGVLMDVGIHVIDTIAFLFDDQLRPVKVTAQVGNNFTKVPVEDTATVLIEFQDGMSALIESGWHHNFQNSPHGALEVFGAKGYARTFPTEMHGVLEGAWGYFRPALHPERPHIDASMYAAQMDSFVDNIISKSKPACNGRTGLRNLVLVDAAYRAARKGQAIAIKAY